MTCLICRGTEIVDDVTSVSLARGEMHLVISGVPARVCRDCGEAYVEQDVAARLLQMAQAVSEAGGLDIYCAYSTV